MITPGSLDWAQRISPSKAAAILGVSRYKSQFQMWHQMKWALDPTWHAAHGYADPKPEPHKDIFDTGHAMELALAYLWRLENPIWQLSPGEVQVVNNTMGFPAVATVDRRARRGAFRRVLEMKTARSLEEWGDDFTDEAPADYVVQVMTQMHFTGWNEHPAHLMVMGPYLKHHTYVIPYDPELGAHIQAKCQDWWRSLLKGDEPDLDNRTETYETVRDLHPDIDGSDVEINEQLAWEWLLSELSLKHAKTTNTGLRSQILAHAGRAQTLKVRDLKVGDRRKNGHGTVSLYPALKSIDKIGNPL